MLLSSPSYFRFSSVRSKIWMSNLYNKDWFNCKGVNVKKCFFILIVLGGVFIFTYHLQSKIQVYEAKILLSNIQPSKDIVKYLINTSKCRIPNQDPFNEEARKCYYREEYIHCSTQPLLSYIQKNNSFVTLHINESLQNYSFYKISCCYSNISRIVVSHRPDNDVRFSECQPFDYSINVTSPLIMVKCKTPMNIEIYSNVHAIQTVDQLEERKLKDWSQTSTVPYSVLFIGIDSISRTNLVRTMPKTYKFLEEHDFINLKGYTKIGDNTFPNLMAILTGKLWTQVYEHCNPQKNRLNNCDIIWDRFRQLGYITAYGEDQSNLGTFHYGRQGFDNPPTSFYFRPYILAAEKLPSIKKHNLYTCSGPETSGERIMNLAKDFQYTFKNFPKFGLFWMNTFSHNDLNTPSSMDDKVEIFFEDIYKHLQNTILIFLSDHGFRFGDIRYTHTGWLEERLPFIYVHYPESFKRKYPQEFDNFQTNSRRLTSPFDLYMTLQDILHFANQSYSIEPSLGCPKCHSLFKVINETRTCEDASIEEHWCVCSGFSYINPTKEIVIDTANFIVSEINNIVKSSKEGSKCAFYLLKKIMSAGMSDMHLNPFNETVRYFLIMLETIPSAKFEATVEANMTQSGLSTFRLSGDISRTNEYAEDARCVRGSLEKYCYCNNLLSRFKKIMCSFWICL